MDKEIEREKPDLRNLYLPIILTIVAGVWGFFNPGRLAERSGFQLLDVMIPAPVLLVVTIIIGLVLVVIGQMKDLKFQIVSGMTIYSKQISLLGALISVLAAFSFVGYDALLFIIYYYEIFILFIYWVVSMTVIPSAICALIALILIITGMLLAYRKEDLNLTILKRTVIPLQIY